MTKSIPATETRRAGFLGLRTENVEVTKSIQVSELVIGPHWILHHTDHHIESHDRGKFVEYGEQNYWALQNDGALLKIWDWEEFTRWDNGTTRFEKECTAAPMTEEDILRLDFADRRYEQGSHGRGAKYWGNREAGPRVRHAEGAGLSVALKALLP